MSDTGFLRRRSTLVVACLVVVLASLVTWGSYRVLLRLSALESDVAALRRKGSQDAESQLADEVTRSRSVIIKVSDRLVRGSGGPVVLVEFADYECPFCIRHSQSDAGRLMTAYIDSGRARYIFQHMPVQSRPSSMRAHAAALCAPTPEQAWTLHGDLFGPPVRHSLEELRRLVREHGLDEEDYSRCADAPSTGDELREAQAVASLARVYGTPTFLVGLLQDVPNRIRVLERIDGAAGYEAISAALDRALRYHLESRPNPSLR